MTKTLNETRTFLKELYQADQRPWVVAYSGGKDSTLLLQLICEFLLSLPLREKQIFVLSTDTRVEAPKVARYVADNLVRIESWAQAQSLPISVRLEQPSARESYWAKLIGKGYPPPSRWFRWCTSNLKIKPARRVIETIGRNYGSVILLLGTRLDESTQRRNAMTSRELNARGLNPHHEIPNALVATPISAWSTDDVWEYLATTPPPWNGDHGELIRLYRQAAGGECPVVLDLNTPSCGGSRFGCWTCTVVKEDKSMQGFIQTGDEQLVPLFEFRNNLAAYRDTPGMRSKVKRDGTPRPGPFTPEARQQLLREVLDLEKKIGQTIISDDELAVIQSQWSEDFDFSETTYKIAHEYGRDVPMEIARRSTGLADEDRLLEQLAEEFEVHPDLPFELLHLVRKKYPSLDVYGAKPSLERDIVDLIEKAVAQIEAADPFLS
ncbi:DNA phosphorothioation system sulfurtransferase DndC [Methylocaldum sp.]|uniref:DNA phosphorothioation system sulfurtransferase DndC n=1 Tax=Methylocaldum sp. TaxID=1969727 RepID=UPI002D2D56E2|nr:DNA phosphorothioation system sulfurtransferase DndC [Methylocaldum sp.]HYE36011.1 DNA phosphorothioation system sulfurtransferase DndC [Methylocaldum sp.]